MTLPFQLPFWRSQLRNKMEVTFLMDVSLLNPSYIFMAFESLNLFSKGSDRINAADMSHI